MQYGYLNERHWHSMVVARKLLSAANQCYMYRNMYVNALFDKMIRLTDD